MKRGGSHLKFEVLPFVNKKRKIEKRESVGVTDLLQTRFYVRVM